MATQVSAYRGWPPETSKHRGLFKGWPAVLPAVQPRAPWKHREGDWRGRGGVWPGRPAWLRAAVVTRDPALPSLLFSRQLGRTVPSHRGLCCSLRVTKNPERDFIFKLPAVGAPRGAGLPRSLWAHLPWVAAGLCCDSGARPLRAAGLAPSNPPWFNLLRSCPRNFKNGNYFERKRMWRRKKRIASGSVLVLNNALLLPQ